MTDASKILELVGQIYDCAIDPEAWPSVMHRIGEEIGAKAAVLLMLDPLRRERRLIAHWNVDPAMDDAYQRQFIQIDPTLTLGWFQEVGQPYSVCAALGRDEFTSSVLYKEWLRKFGYHDNMQLVLARSANRYCGVSFLRAHERGDYADDEIKLMRQLSPHFRRAVTIADLLDSKALAGDLMSATLDLLTAGLVLVDGHGRIVHTNRAASEMLAARDGLRRDGDMLAAVDPRSARDLAAAMVDAATAATTPTAAQGFVLPIATAAGHDLAVWVLPLDSGLRQNLAAPFRARAAVFIRHIGATAPFPGELFVKRYAITPAECRVLMLLTQGMTPADVATCLGIAQATVRTHMMRLFEKTGTSGQPELMRPSISALAPAAI